VFEPKFFYRMLLVPMTEQKEGGRALMKRTNSRTKGKGKGAGNRGEKRFSHVHFIIAEKVSTLKKKQ
jgi:hypothetical protein